MTPKFLSFWHVNFWKITILHLNGQYAHQMKAKIILNLYLSLKGTIGYENFLEKEMFKNLSSNFFFFENRSKKFWNSSFFKKFSYPIVLFDDKYEFRMILAFIWYAYCPCRCKIVIFHKLTCQKLENLGVKLSYFGITLQKKYGS